jgi:tRNA uridine 5-carboxymethylaminomethyl modification enzyme
MGSHGIQPQQVNCHIAYTTEKTHGIIRQASHLSPMYTGQITDVGPRYCPSIEDKVERFADKASHQIFVEPEGLGLNEIYPNGISTSLPFEVQIDFVRSIPGFEQAHVTRPGYAIEYDFFDPRDLQYSLETKYMPGLFFAGQINGTTGYEEAGAQGIIAGLNAARRVFGLASWTPGRDQAYIGVLIDDLITQGAQEPYRMFTSRAEYRLSLREDNADLRLTELGYNLGIVAKDRYERFQYKQSQVEQEINRLKPILIRPHSRSADKLRQLSGESLSKETHAHELLRRPAVTYQHLTELEEVGKGVQDSAISRQIEIQTKYEGYLRRQQIDIERQQRHESTAIPNNIDFDQVSGLSNEVKQKLRDIKPHTIGQASRIEGMTPAAISLLLVHIKKGA